VQIYLTLALTKYLVLRCTLDIALFSSPFSLHLFLVYLYFLDRNIKLVALVIIHCSYFCFDETLEQGFTNRGKRTILGTSKTVHSYDFDKNRYIKRMQILKRIQNISRI